MPPGQPPPPPEDSATIDEATDLGHETFWQHPFVQTVLPFLTSLTFHITLIVLGILIYGGVKHYISTSANKEQAIVPEAPIDDAAQVGGILHPGPQDDPNRDPAQDKLPNVKPDPNGWASKKSDELNKAVNPGGGAGDAVSDLIASGSNLRAGKGRGSGGGTGDMFGGGAGDGSGPLAPFGTPGGGGGFGPRASFVGISGNARKVVFILDATGSMMAKFDDLRAEVRKAIDNLRPPQSFNVVFFQEGMKEPCLGKELFFATPENKKKVEDFVDHVTPRGRTDPIPAIKIAFQMQPQLVYFLVDPGDFPDNQAVINTFKTLNTTHAVVNAIAFWDRDESGEKVLKQIAMDGHGIFRPVGEADLGK